MEVNCSPPQKSGRVREFNISTKLNFRTKQFTVRVKHDVEYRTVQDVK